MDRMFVVKSIQYRLAESENSTWASINDLGYSVIRLKQLAGRDAATGVRAKLAIEDQEAIQALARHYATNTRLEWWFEIEGGCPFSVVLRWTTFERSTGDLQVVRTAVLRDLIAEAEQKGSSSSDREPGPRPSSPDEQFASEPRGSNLTREANAASESSSEASSDDFHPNQQVSELWPTLLGEDGRLKSRSSERS